MIESREGTGYSVKFRRAVRRPQRVFTVLAGVTAVLGFNLASSVGASADAYWTNAIELPGLATLNQSGVSPGPMVCTSSGNCVSGGGYTDGNQNEQAFLSQETSGVWSSATEIAGNLNVGGGAQVTAISCPSAGDCTAVGFYLDAGNAEHSFVINQVSGTWAFPTELPDFTTLTNDDASEVDTLSCSSATTCVGVGSYLDAATQVAEPIIYTETNGAWATPVEAQGSATFNTGGVAEVLLLDCTSATTCVASGNIYQSIPELSIEPFLINETNGAWGSVEAVPGVSTLNRQDDAGMTSLSCGASGDCAAGGDYLDSTGATQAFIINEVGGVWDSATQLFATQTLGSGLDNALNDIVCPSAGNCTAIGGYADTQGVSQPFVIDEANHVWNPAIEIPGVATLNDSDGATLYALSCSSFDVCSAGGTYLDGGSNSQAFVVNDAAGTWSNPIEVPGTSSLNKGGTANVSQVSCSGDGSCGVQGSYSDASDNTQLFVSNSSTVAPTTVSSAPRNVKAVDKKGVITVHWTAPSSNGGAAITSYTVVSLPKSKTCVTRATSCVFKGLNKKVHYSFEVRATNKDGPSALSARSNAVRAT